MDWHPAAVFARTDCLLAVLASVSFICLFVHTYRLRERSRLLTLRNQININIPAAAVKDLRHRWLLSHSHWGLSEESDVAVDGWQRRRMKWRQSAAWTRKWSHFCWETVKKKYLFSFWSWRNYIFKKWCFEAAFSQSLVDLVFLKPASSWAVVSCCFRYYINLCVNSNIIIWSVCSSEFSKVTKHFVTPPAKHF